MPKGGARNRSGPSADPSSGRSEARGLIFTALPSEGYAGTVPAFCLPPHAFANLATREAEVWAEAWRTPQACAWSVQSWRWPVVAEYVRLKVLCESTDANASSIAQLHRYRDQLGLTPAGLKENGWAIASDEVGRKAAQRERPSDTPPADRRLRAAGGNGGA